MSTGLADPTVGKINWSQAFGPLVVLFGQGGVDEAQPDVGQSVSVRPTASHSTERHLLLQDLSGQVNRAPAGPRSG